MQFGNTIKKAQKIAHKEYPNEKYCILDSDIILPEDFIFSVESLTFYMYQMLQVKPILRVPRAVTWLTVYRALQVVCESKFFMQNSW